MTDMNVVPAGLAASFERIRRNDDAGMEFWSSRELAQVLGYEDYRNFISVLEKARIACENSGITAEDHFVDVTDMITLGSGVMPEELPAVESIKKVETRQRTLNAIPEDTQEND